MPAITREFQQHDGPVLSHVVFHVSVPRFTALVRAGEQPPSPVTGRALIDAGASSSCIDPSVTSSLGLEPHGTVPVHTPSTGDHPHLANQTDLSIIVPPAYRGDAPLVLGAVSALESRLLEHQNIHALIGRDVLARCTFLYEGAANRFVLSW